MLAVVLKDGLELNADLIGLARGAQLDSIANVVRAPRNETFLQNFDSYAALANIIHITCSALRLLEAYKARRLPTR
jgi:hypothetical protein